MYSQLYSINICSLGSKYHVLIYPYKRKKEMDQLNIWFSLERISVFVVVFIRQLFFIIVTFIIIFWRLWPWQRLLGLKEIKLRVDYVYLLARHMQFPAQYKIPMRKDVDYKLLKIISKNILFYMSFRLSKIRSVHTYVIPRTVYFGWICNLGKL